MQGGMLAELIGKRSRPQGELEAIQDRFDRNVSPNFADAETAITSGAYSRALLGGGRGSMKSSFVSLLIVRECERESKACALILRKISNTLRGSVFEQIRWAMDTLGVSDHWEETVSPMEFTNTRTGQKIIFRGLDEPRKLKSIKTRRGMYFKFVWFEELDEFEGEQEIDSVLESALRGGPSGSAICTYNPPKSANNWVNKLAAAAPKSCYVHHSDYTQAPEKWLGQTFIRMAEEMKQKDPRRYRWVYLGEPIGEGGNVFANVRVIPISEDERRRFNLKPCIGMDFGYVDPNVLIKTHLEDRVLYVYEEFYRAGMSTREIAAACRKIARDGELIRADNAAKQTIIDLRNDYGINITGVSKGPNSRKVGYEWLRDLDGIVIDPRTCPNAAREFTSYEYARTKDGQMIERFPDGDDHSIDAVAYGNRDNVYRSRRTRNISGKGARR